MMVDNGESAAPWVLRREGHDNGTWNVIDRSTGDTVGVIFKYIGSWWANNTSTVTNRCGSKERAAKVAWDVHNGGNAR